MWRSFEKYLNQLRARRYHRRIEGALGLNRRGEVRSDGLILHKTLHRLEIQWRAREIHPWDSDLPAERRSLLFVEQSLADTEAAINRLFRALPHIDVINLTVLESASDNVIMAGTVYRSALGRDHQSLSVRMRLMELGVNWRLASAHFEPLDVRRRMSMVERM